MLRLRPLSGGRHILAKPPHAKMPILIQPTFTHRDTRNEPYRPTAREVLRELIDVMNILSHPTHLLTALNFLFQCLVSVTFFVFLFWYISFATLSFILASIILFGTFYNTVWYHRYCSHVAFEFSNLRWPLLLAWTNPLAFIFREEIYAIPHRIHHLQTERASDPYGPHLGWLASFLAPELTQRLETGISEKNFALLSSSIGHIGLHTSSYTSFRRTGSVESLTFYLARVLLSQSFWVVTIFAVGGLGFVLAWFAAIFVITMLIRDFNWRGHGGNFRQGKKKGWEFDEGSYALNQHFYGYLASEWHDNHHKYPVSANNGFLPGQIDIAFQIINLMRRLGIVKSYMDARPIFEKECLVSATKA
jgi:sn-1 stearoyl-lipid 9-desaturase